MVLVGYLVVGRSDADLAALLPGLVVAGKGRSRSHRGGHGHAKRPETGARRGVKEERERERGVSAYGQMDGYLTLAAKRSQRDEN